MSAQAGGARRAPHTEPFTAKFGSERVPLPEPAGRSVRQDPGAYSAAVAATRWTRHCVSRARNAAGLMGLLRT
jgi:hypothetical protein